MPFINSFLGENNKIYLCILQHAKLHSCKSLYIGNNFNNFLSILYRLVSTATFFFWHFRLGHYIPELKSYMAINRQVVKLFIIFCSPLIWRGQTCFVHQKVFCARANNIFMSPGTLNVETATCKHSKRLHKYYQSETLRSFYNNDRKKSSNVWCYNFIAFKFCSVMTAIFITSVLFLFDVLPAILSDSLSAQFVIVITMTQNEESLKCW